MRNLSTLGVLLLGAVLCASGYAPRIQMRPDVGEIEYKAASFTNDCP